MLNTTNTLTANLTTGALTPSAVVSARASLAITLTGTGSLTTGNMRAALYRLNRSGIDGTIVATCNTFTAFVGAMTLNTTELVAAFTDLEAVRQGEIARFDLLIWDASNSLYMVWDHLDVSYEFPLVAGTSNVSPISTGTTLWGNFRLINGVVSILSLTDNKYYPLTLAGQDTTVHEVLGETGTP